MNTLLIQLFTGETKHDDFNGKEKKWLTVTVDNEFLSSNWRMVISIWPLVCSSIRNGMIVNESLR
jgi:hypothetical protein